MARHTAKMATHPLDRLFATVSARAGSDPTQSYTARLLAEGRQVCAKKLGEEAIEAALAGASGDSTALTEESADLLYHLQVLWLACGVTPEEVYAALARREGRSGLEEKAARKS